MSVLVVVRRAITTALTIVAFANSYAHTVTWFEDNGQTGSARWLAAIPEAGLILALLFLATGQLGRLQRALVWAVAAGSVGITISANLAGAGDGPASKVAALVAPVFAILGFGLELAPSRTRTEDQPEAGPHPVPDRTESRTKTAGPPNQNPGPKPVVHPDQTTGPLDRTTGPKPVPDRTKPKGPPRTTPRTRTTDQQRLDKIRDLITNGVLPDTPSATRIQAALGCNKAKAGELRDKLAATEAEDPTATATG